MTLPYSSKVWEPRELLVGQPVSMTGNHPDLFVYGRTRIDKVPTVDNSPVLISYVLGQDPTSAPLYLPANSVIHVEALVTATNAADQGGSWHLEATFRSSAVGHIVQIGTITTVHEQKTDVGLAASIAGIDDGTGVVAVVVTGLAATNLKWVSTTRYTLNPNT